MKKTLTGLLILSLFQIPTGCSVKKAGLSHEIQAADIIRQLDKGEHIFIDSCIIWGDLDFTSLRNRNKIAANLSQVFINQSITFNDCVFIGNVRAFDPTNGVCVEFMHNLSFTKCDFRSDVDFTEIVVGGNAFFTGSVFRGTAQMQGAYFRHKKVYFNEAAFEKEALFQNVIFAGDVNFMHTVFSAPAMFQKTHAGGLMFFGNVKFDKYVDFSYARAVESIFNYAQFNERYDFGYSQLNAEGLSVQPTND